jgi:hypothetical protein
MKVMLQYDLIIKQLENIITENAKCEDNKILLSRKIKYDIWNLLAEIDTPFINKLLKDLEYVDKD